MGLNRQHIQEDLRKFWGLSIVLDMLYTCQALTSTFDFVLTAKDRIFNLRLTEFFVADRYRSHRILELSAKLSEVIYINWPTTLDSIPTDEKPKMTAHFLRLQIHSNCLRFPDSTACDIYCTNKSNSFCLLLQHDRKIIRVNGGCCR